MTKAEFPTVSTNTLPPPVYYLVPNQLTLLIAGQIQLIFFLFNKPNMDKIKRCLKPYIGIGICALASLFFCVCNVFVKHLKHVDPLLIGCLRLFVMAMLSSPVTVLRFYEVELSTKVPTYLVTYLKVHTWFNYNRC